MNPGRKSSSLGLPKTMATSVILVIMISFAVVFGALAVLAGFSGGSSGTSPSTYPVLFQESGLPSGSMWGVAVAGVSYYSNGSDLQVQEPAGIYQYAVINAAGYHALNRTGSINVTTGGLTVAPFYFVSNSIPLGTAFDAGGPVWSGCPIGDTYSVEGCQSQDTIYRISIYSSTVPFGNVLFAVETSTGANFTIPSGTGGISIINLTSGEVAVQMGSVPTGGSLAMNAPWSFYNGFVTATTPLTNAFSILLDMGTGDTLGEGLSLVGYGIAPYGGTTGPIPLP